MSLREEFDLALQEKNAQAKKEADIQAKYRLLPEEVRALFADYPEADAYQASLPLHLVPAAKELISELISLCPAEYWQAPPVKADVSDICFYPGYYDYGNIIPDRYTYGGRMDTSGYAQYRATDGSIHAGQYNLSRKKEFDYSNLNVPFRFTRRGRDAALEEAVEKQKLQVKEAFLREIQEALDKCTRDTRENGSREFFIMSYSAGEASEGSIMPSSKPIIIFRDGAVYDPYQSTHHRNYSCGGVSSPLAWLPESLYKEEGAVWSDARLNDFRELCTRTVRLWAAISGR